MDHGGFVKAPWIMEVSWVGPWFVRWGPRGFYRWGLDR